MWLWEISDEGALFPPTITSFVDGWRQWAGVLEAGPAPVADIFAREFIQNFADAADEFARDNDTGDTPSLSFRFLRLQGADAAQFRSALQLNDHVSRFASFSPTEREDHRLSESELLHGADSVSVLIATERYATGMYGPWAADGRALDSGGRRIVRKMRDALVKPSGDKGTATSLGSYGEGKRGVALASKMRALVAYTCFKPIESEPDVTRRLLGVTYWRKHVEGEWERTGLALFGKHGRDQSRERAEPFTDEAADIALGSFGIPQLELRSAERDRDCGTTWIIVEPAFDADQLVWAIERNWWPRIESHDLSVSVVGDDGVERRVSPVERRELRPFVEAYHIACGTRPARERLDVSRRLRVNSAVVADVGSLGLTVDLDDEGWSWDQPERNVNMVALVRGGMVIQYETFPRKRPISVPPFVRGTLVVDGDAQGHLRLAEPPLHNYWAESTETGYSADAVELARKTYARLQDEVREFAKRFRQVPPPREFRFELFARFFRASEEVTVVPPPPDPSRETRDPWAIRMSAPERLEADSGDSTKIRVIAERFVQLKDDWNLDEVPVEVQIGWRVLEDSDEGVEAPELSDASRDLVPEGFARRGDVYVGTLTKTPVRFGWTSGFYENDWLTRASLEVSAMTDEVE